MGVDETWNEGVLGKLDRREVREPFPRGVGGQDGFDAAVPDCHGVPLEHQALRFDGNYPARKDQGRRGV
jgi:hypothetical protein